MTGVAETHLVETNQIARQRAVMWVFAGAALAAGAFAALGSAAWLGSIAAVLLFSVAALTLPLPWVAGLLAALIPFQFYFNVPGSSFTLRGAVLFVFVAAMRVSVRRFARAAPWTKLDRWMLPATIFLFAAVAAALGAANRYLAFKGIYDWLIIFATAFVVSHTVDSAQMFKRLALVVLMIGVAEAILGLLQYLLGLNAVLAWLRQPLSGWLFQPNLLAERLGDVSFNWVVFDRASPFGTFINGIDYAIFIAAILGLALATLIVERGRATETFALFVSVLLMGVALLLTFKGSGMIALAGAAATIALFYMPRPSPRVLVIGLTGLIVVFLLALPFADLIAQRAAFLLLREQGALGTAGRLDTWASLFDRFLQRPLFGYGLNHAALLTEPTRTLRAGTIAFNAPTAESAYVGALVETGAIGFGALMAWFALVAARAYRRIREDKRLIGILAALVALWLGNLTVAGFTTDQNGMLLGLFIGMVLGRWKNP